MKIAACLIVAACTTASAETIRTYHVGNSLTWDMQPGGLDQLATSMGHDHVAGYDIRCSQPLPSIWAQATSPCVTPNMGEFDDALPGQAWDAVPVPPETGMFALESELITIGTCGTPRAALFMLAINGEARSPL